MTTYPTPSAWTRLRAAVDPVTRRFTGFYAAYPLTPEEYVTTAHADDLLAALDNAGYTAQRLSASKKHPSSGRLHALSVRRVPEAHPPEAIGTALAEYHARSCQYHVHAFRTDVRGYYDVFSHYEYRPFCAPLRHYRPQYDFEHVERAEWSYLRGVRDPALDLGRG